MAGQHSRSTVDVDTKGFLEGLNAAFADFRIETRKDAVTLAIVIENRAKELCAVDTGRLRSSIGHEEGADDQGFYVDVGTNVDYGPFVEFGTSDDRAQPFLRPAVAEAVGYGAAVSAAVKSLKRRRR